MLQDNYCGECQENLRGSNLREDQQQVRAALRRDLERTDCWTRAGGRGGQRARGRRRAVALRAAGRAASSLLPAAPHLALSGARNLARAEPRCRSRGTADPERDGAGARAAFLVDPTPLVLRTALRCGPGCCHYSIDDASGLREARSLANIAQLGSELSLCKVLALPPSCLSLCSSSQNAEVESCVRPYEVGSSKRPALIIEMGTWSLS